MAFGCVFGAYSPLSQLHRLAFALKNSPTILLPRWHEICDEKQLNDCVIPRDVRTRWNSTYDMLEFCIKYREAIDALCGERNLNLRRYELDDNEWKLATQLRDVLSVHYACHSFLDHN